LADNLPMQEIVLPGFAAIVVLMFAAWLLSLLLRNVAIVDVFWGIAIAGAGVTWLSVQANPGQRGALAVLLAVLWAVRLALHILWRSRGKPEDRRYRVIRARNEPNFAFKSLYLVFGLQSLLALVVAMPLLGATLSTRPLGGFDLAGAGVWLAGFVLQVTADIQLARFQKRPDADRAVMDRGAWRYSRHPNYFGEFLMWWGIWLMAAAGGAWWTCVGPVLLTFLLLRVSGVALTEKDIASRRHGYQDYLRRTSAFIPWPPT
jgi:steroid 5-alpha reductase family enzyme